MNFLVDNIFLLQQPPLSRILILDQSMQEIRPGLNQLFSVNVVGWKEGIVLVLLPMMEFAEIDSQVFQLTSI